MSRNYGLGSREMSKAGQFALKNASKSGHLSYSSAGTIGDRWAKFSNWAREQGIKKMEDITADTVKTYASTLSNLAPSTAQNYISAINTVMSLATKSGWESVSPTKECSIDKRSHARTESTPDRETIQSALASIQDARLQVVGTLMHELGLRSKEASLIDARGALREATERYRVTISDGTKGGRSREVEITRPEQLQALQRAADVQDNHRSMIPPDQTWSQWREGNLRDLRESLQEQGIDRLHDLRAAYAVERFQYLTGHAAPIAGGYWDRQADRIAAEQLAEELGHGRTDVLASYIGR